MKGKKALFIVIMIYSGIFLLFIFLDILYWLFY